VRRRGHRPQIRQWKPPSTFTFRRVSESLETNSVVVHVCPTSVLKTVLRWDDIATEITMYRGIVILLSPLLLAALALSVVAAPQSLAAEPQVTAIAAPAQTQQDDYTRGFRDGYRQGRDDGEVDGRLDCQLRQPRKAFGAVQNDYQRCIQTAIHKATNPVTSAMSRTLTTTAVSECVPCAGVGQSRWLSRQPPALRQHQVLERDHSGRAAGGHGRRGDPGLREQPRARPPERALR
jgi:hypothetical protein